MKGKTKDVLKRFGRLGILILLFVTVSMCFSNILLRKVSAQSNSESLEAYTDGKWTFFIVDEEQKQVVINGILEGKESQCIDRHGCLVIPSSVEKSSYEKYTVVGIDTGSSTNEEGRVGYFNAFQLMDSFASVYIPEGVEYIGSQVFYNCSVESVTFPKSLRSIGKAAFGHCDQLEYIELPDNLEILGESCFRESGLISVTIPNKVKVISDFAFCDCTALKSIVLPEELEELGEYAFPEDQGLEITIPEKLTDISHLNLINLSGVIFNVVEGGEVAMYLTEHNITYNTYPPAKQKPTEEEKTTETPTEKPTEEEGKTEATTAVTTDNPEKEEKPTEKPSDEEKGDSTSKPTENEQPEEKPEIKKGSTYTVDSLDYKVLSNKQVSFAGTNNKSIKTLNIPATVMIGDSTFKVVQIEKRACKGFKKLQSVTVGKNVSIISDEAFMNCKSLKTITFGIGTKTIGKKVLKGDKNLTKVLFKGKKLKKIGKGTFAGTSLKKIKFIVPKSKNSKYKQQYAKLIKKAK